MCKINMHTRQNQDYICNVTVHRQKINWQVCNTCYTPHGVNYVMKIMF